MTIVAYGVTVALAAFGVTTMLGTVLADLLRRIASRAGVHVGVLAGGLVTWLAVSMVWQAEEGGPMPMAALAASLVVMTLHSTKAGHGVDPNAPRGLAANVCAILLVGVWIAVTSEAVRWY